MSASTVLRRCQTATRTPRLILAADAQSCSRLLARYRDPSLGRSATEIAITIVPLAALWASMWALLHVSYGLSLVLAIPAAGFLVRLFMIQHDCGHGSFFRNRALNDWVGRAIGIVTLTPYDYWKRTHAAHHASSGNLDRRGMGDINTITVREYLAMNWRGRLFYRLYRHPAVMCSASSLPISSSCSTGRRWASCAARAGGPGSAPWRPMPGSP